MEFFILFLSLINVISGIMFLATLPSNPPGFIFVLFVGAILTIIGLTGLALWTIQFLKTPGRNFQTSVALKNWLQITKSVDILLILGFLFRTFVLQPFLVDGNSMEPNYHNQEFLLVDRISYKLIDPKRGQVIIFLFPQDINEDYIKRLIGLPGETITIENGQVFINGQKLNEPYLQDATTTIGGLDATMRKTLGPDEYFVLGDNRNHSSDSREWGVLPRKNILGRTWFVVYPFSQTGLVKNPQYVYLLQLSKLITSRSVIWAKF